MKKSLAFLIAGALGSCLIAAVAYWQRSLYRTANAAILNGHPSTDRKRSPIVTEEKRKVYPYSIVPGGARSVQEARRAMSDPVIRFHYADVSLKDLKQMILTADLTGYVSYRFGDKIYWTSKAIHLKAGETVFSDGRHIVRGRCLNSYSAHPMMPVRPNEPSEKTLDTPVEVPVIALTFPNLPLSNPALSPPSKELTAVVPTASGTAPGHPGGSRFFPIVPIIPPIHKHRPRPPSAVVPPGTPVPPVSVVPEPRYSWAIPGLLLAVLIFRRGLRRQKIAMRGLS